MSFEHRILTRRELLVEELGLLASRVGLIAAGIVQFNGVSSLFRERTVIQQAPAVQTPAVQEAPPAAADPLTEFLKAPSGTKPAPNSAEVVFIKDSKPFRAIPEILRRRGDIQTLWISESQGFTDPEQGTWTRSLPFILQNTRTRLLNARQPFEWQFETYTTEMLFDKKITTRWATVFINRYGNIQLPYRHSDTRDAVGVEFIALGSTEQGILIPPTVKKAREPQVLSWY